MKEEVKKTKTAATKKVAENKPVEKAGKDTKTKKEVEKKPSALETKTKSATEKVVKTTKKSIVDKGTAKYPFLCQINTRVLLTELSETLKRKATLDDIPDSMLDEIKKVGFDWIWLLTVWTTGSLSKNVSCTNPDWLNDYKNTLPDLKKEDIAGSGFAVADYKVSSELGGDLALKNFRERMNKRGLKLMLDFVPNHMGLDHEWINTHSDYFISGTEEDVVHCPQNYIKLKIKGGDKVFAYGRDPYFSGWPDTLQIDYSNPNAVKAMKGELLRISEQCDGVRCDMAMLILPDVFERTWGRKAEPFWMDVITKIRKKNSDFCFLAEVYWGMEWDLQQLGFDYTYDKTLYDRLKGGNVKTIREHLTADLEYQNKLSRFLENHDEERASQVFFEDQHKAAAVITYFSPGMRFFHQGQFEGKTKRISPHLARSPKEDVKKSIYDFYINLLKQLNSPVFKNGEWILLNCAPAWEGNDSSKNLISYAWENKAGERLLVITNYCGYPAQGYLKLPFQDIASKKWKLDDLLSEYCYLRSGDDLQNAGLYLDMNPWQYHVFVMKNN